MLQSVVMTVNVLTTSPAVRIVCAEKPVFSAPSISIATREKSAVMTETARQIVGLGLEPALPALWSARSCFSRLFFPSWLAVVVHVAHVTAIAPLGLS